MFCIAGEKYSSPGVTLRFHEVKTRDEKRSVKVTAVTDVACYSSKR
jgi:hypothetical protein